eukprot:4214670-Pleurochrysis_carterae.AAC.1
MQPPNPASVPRRGGSLAVEALNCDFSQLKPSTAAYSQLKPSEDPDPKPNHEPHYNRQPECSSLLLCACCRRVPMWRPKFTQA